MSRKEGTSLTVRDYTDDIYNANSGLSVNNFLEGKT